MDKILRWQPSDSTFYHFIERVRQIRGPNLTLFLPWLQISARTAHYNGAQSICSPYLRKGCLRTTIARHQTLVTKWTWPRGPNDYGETDHRLHKFPNVYCYRLGFVSSCDAFFIQDRNISSPPREALVYISPLPIPRGLHIIEWPYTPLEGSTLNVQQGSGWVGFSKGSLPPALRARRRLQIPDGTIHLGHWFIPQLYVAK